MRRRLLRVVLHGRIQVLELIVAELDEDRAQEGQRRFELGRLLAGVFFRELLGDRVEVL